jgi:hypothetical protein
MPIKAFHSDELKSLNSGAVLLRGPDNLDVIFKRESEDRFVIDYKSMEQSFGLKDLEPEDLLVVSDAFTSIFRRPDANIRKCLMAGKLPPKGSRVLFDTTYSQWAAKHAEAKDWKAALLESTIMVDGIVRSFSPADLNSPIGRRSVHLTMPSVRNPQKKYTVRLVPVKPLRVEPPEEPDKTEPEGPKSEEQDKS